MRRDVQLIINKDVLVPESIDYENLYEDNLLNSEDETIHNFTNHASINGGNVKLTSISGSTASISQSNLGLEDGSSYLVNVNNLSYGSQRSVTNKAFKSQEFNDLVWTKTNSSVTSNNAIAPDGTLTADYISCSNSTNYIYDAHSQVDGQPITISLYVKKNTSSIVSLMAFEGDGKSDFNLDSGTLLGEQNTMNYSKIENVGNGWYRISAVHEAEATGTYNFGFGDLTNGDSIWVWGFQLEDGNTLNPYVKNLSSIATATTNVDRTAVHTITVSDTVDGTGGLLEVIDLESGMVNKTLNFTANSNSDGLYVYLVDETETFEVEIGQLDLYKRIPAYMSTEDVNIDMFDFEDINIVDKIKDARDISKVFTEYSQQFTVPASPKNNELFGHFYNPELISGYDHRLKHSAVIKIGGADYKHGKISLTSSNMKNGNPYSYSLVFYGNTVTLKDLIADDTLPDLENTILDALNIEYSSTSVKQLVENGLEFDENEDLVAAPSYTVKTPDVFIPFISCDSHYFYDSADAPQVKDRVDSRNLRWGSNQDKKGLYYKDLKLAVKIKHVIKAIEQKYGITFSDDFFNENNAAYSELCLFMHREKGGITSQLESSSDSFSLSELDKLRSSGIPRDKQSEFRGSSGSYKDQYTSSWNLDYLSVVETGKTVLSVNRRWNIIGPMTYSYRIDFDLNVVGSGEYIIEIIDNSTDSSNSNNYYFIGTGSNSVSHTFKKGSLGSGPDSKAKYMYVKPKIKITTKAGISSYAVSNFKLTRVEGLTGQINSSTSEATWYDMDAEDPTRYALDGGNQQPLVGSGVGIQAQLPNMKVLDFLTSIFKMFNLTAYLVPETEIGLYSGQIRVRPLDAFYLGGSEVDITEFIDESSVNVKRNTLYSSVEYEFSDHKTLAAIKQNERTSDVFGSEVMNNLSRDLNAPVAFDGGKYKVKANFEKVMYERMTDQSDESTVMDIQWGWMCSKDENPVLGKPLLFYPIVEDISSSTDATGSLVKIDFDSSIYDKNKDLVTASHSYITRYFRPSNSLKGNLQSINFGSEYDEWYVWEGAGSNENSLFQSYHKNYLLGLYDKQSRLIDVSAYLPIRIVMKLKLEDVVIIKGRKYRINSLKLNITTGEAKIELMNDLAYSNIILNSPTIELAESFTNGNLFTISDLTPNNDTVYKLYSDGVYVMDFTNENAFLSDSVLSSGSHTIMARKAKYYDNTTFIESADSNEIEITV